MVLAHPFLEIISTIILSTTDTREVDELSVAVVKNVNLELDNCSMSMPRASVLRPTDDSPYGLRCPTTLKHKSLASL